MARQWSRARAPASLMLFGEHSVLRGGVAVVGAVDAFLTVELESRSDDQIRIVSSLGEEQTCRFQPNLSSTFRFLQAVLKSFQGRISTGFTCLIKSDFPPTQGLGSSAALTIAAIGALGNLLDFSESNEVLHTRALEVIRSVQGRGSGADLAASLLGGVVAYKAFPEVHMEKIATELDLTICFSGYKTTTPEVIRFVEERKKHYPELIQGLLQIQGSIASEAAEAIRGKILDRLAYLSQASQGVMEAIGVSDPTLSRLAWLLRSDSGIYGSKISGSGLGDCVIGFGKLRKTLLLPAGCELLPLEITNSGLFVEGE